MPNSHKQIKDIVRFQLHHINGDPLVKVSFLLNSDRIILSLPKDRIHNSYSANPIFNNTKKIVGLLCYDHSKLWLHSRFEDIQDIYYYPFNSSIFTLPLFISSNLQCYAEITLPEGYKQLTKLSNITDYATKRWQEKEFETWAQRQGTFHYSLNEQNLIKLTMRSDGRSTIYGILHLILPTLIIMVGVIFEFGNLSSPVMEYAPGILVAILLTLTPFYANILQQFITRSFMALNLGLILYIVSYCLSLLIIFYFVFIQINILFPSILVFLWVCLILVNTLRYFKYGAFYKLSKIGPLRWLKEIIRSPLNWAWRPKKDK